MVLCRIPTYHRCVSEEPSLFYVLSALLVVVGILGLFALSWVKSTRPIEQERGPAQDRGEYRRASRLGRITIGHPNNLAHLVWTPRTRIRSQGITRPLARISDNQHLHAALRTRRSKKGRRDFRLYSHSTSQRRRNITALA